jgi:hypothetical protein
MKLYSSIIAILLFQLSLSQITNLTEDQLLKSGNVFLDKYNKINSDIKGNPYYEEKYKEGNLSFSNGKTYEAFIRFNVANQKFEIKKNLNSKSNIIEIDDNIIVYINQEKFKNLSFKINNKLIKVILKECVVTEKYQLYYYPKKLIEKPNKDGIKAPPTGFTKAPQSKWKDDGSFLIFYKGLAYQLPTSHKKMSDLKIFDQELYKKYRKSNKLNLKKEDNLIELVKYFDSI